MKTPNNKKKKMPKTWPQEKIEAKVGTEQNADFKA